VILFDTSVLSLVFRRSRPGPKERRVATTVAELLSGKTPLGLPGIVLQEILSGVRSEKQFADLHRRLLASFNVLLPSAEEFTEAARLKNKCLSRGVRASGPDCLIAAQAITANHELFTTDPDFDAIAKLSPLKLFKLED